jgi:hypothetical protein
MDDRCYFERVCADSDCVSGRIQSGVVRHVVEPWCNEYSTVWLTNGYHTVLSSQSQG